MRLLTSITRKLLPLPGLLATLALAQAAPTRILAFGDSLTAGYRLPPEAAYPSQLEKTLRAEGFDVQVTNAGVSGDTSGQALRRVDWSLKQGPFQWVLLELGANDGLRQLPLKNLEQNLEQMIAKFQGSAARVFLIGMRLPLNFGASYRQGFESIFTRLAHKHHLPFLPFLLDGVALVKDLNLEDALHPNERGQKIVAAHVAQALKPLLSKKTE